MAVSILTTVPFALVFFALVPKALVVVVFPFLASLISACSVFLVPDKVFLFSSIFLAESLFIVSGIFWFILFASAEWLAPILLINSVLAMAVIGSSLPTVNCLVFVSVVL